MLTCLVTCQPGPDEPMLVQRMATSKRLDFIKLDVEGEEKWLLKDKESREVWTNPLPLYDLM